MEAMLRKFTREEQPKKTIVRPLVNSTID